LALAVASGFAVAQSSSTTGTSGNAQRSAGGEAQDAVTHVNKAVNVVHKMESDPAMKKVLQQAKGVFIVPNYTRAAFGVGGQGGGGVLLVKRGGNWSNPAFYDIGGISAGVQAGVETGAIAMVLNNDKAVSGFMKDNKFSLNADAGLTVVNWSKKAQGSAGRGDVVVWADTEGLFGDLAVSVTDIHYDQKETGAYYQKQVAAREVVAGKVTNPHADALKQALASAGTGSATGSSGSGGTSSGGSGSTSGSGGNK
jgi:lipid-binding SYLF domain-containing protein